ncbi:MAG: phage tail protein [Hormoscilla sp. GUM202]|nr:phage tail protein [Hormoscilla sp. GUM202]
MISMESLVNLIAPVDGREGRFYGVAVGVVTNIQDPEKLGRVKVKFPWLSEKDESRWARIVSPMGIYFFPKVEDEVLVIFEHGDMNFPYILGGLWNNEDKPPASGDYGEKTQRLLKSSSGHTIVLDNTEKGEKIILESSSGHTIVLDDTEKGEKIILESSSGQSIVLEDRENGGKIVISDNTGKNKIEIDSTNNTMTIAVENNLIIEAKGKISMKGNEIDMKGNEISMN